MHKFSLLLFLGAGVFTSILAAQEIKRVSVQPTPITSGKAMFTEYCAVCHGPGGQGNGPAADALKKRPADLTQLSRKNGGVFPEIHVIRFIKGDDVVAAHGTRDMPIWGTVLGSLDPNVPAAVSLRVANLENYIKTLQAH
ncbi:MAG TPA: c-type cytochrome [Bryobacteraceae bacterium]|nr:c-type cytochrome [Bryobacteraceae bacterium]